MNTLYKLIGDIRYELSPGIHTFGNCSRCKTGSARGAGVCVDCKVKELGKLVGDKLAKNFAKKTEAVNEAVWMMEEKVGF